MSELNLIFESKRMKFWYFRFLLVISTFVLCIRSEDVVLPCEFSILPFHRYTCTIKSVNISEDTKIIGVNGTHLAGYGNENVTRVDIESSSLKTFPQIVLDTFNNIKYLNAESVSMKNLDRLANCSKLINLYLEYNLLQTIKNSTFENCRNLDDVQLDWNNITHIEPDAFKGLTELTFLLLSKTENFRLSFINLILKILF